MDVPSFAVHPWKDVWIFSGFWLLQIQLLRTFVCRFLYEHKSLFLWNKCQTTGRSHGCYKFHFLRLAKLLQTSILHSHWQRLSNLVSSTLPAFGGTILLFSHSDKCIVISYCGFKFYFPRG